MRVLLQTFLSILMMSLGMQAYADNEAMALLERTSLAAQQLNYDGVFAFQKGNKLQSIRIIHRSDAQGEVERLVSLSGVEREFIRTNDMVTCIYPEGKRPQANRQPLGHGFPRDLLTRLNVATLYYQVTLGEQGRIAAHQAQELLITPVDNYRYGYRLWISKDSDFLLQSDLVDDTGMVLEKFAFSSVEIGGAISEQSLQPHMTGNKMSWSRTESAPPAVAIGLDEASNWKIVWLPEGFVLVAQQNRLKARNGAAVEQRVYSDGLSSVSIFIEKIRARHSHLSGGTRKGPVNAFGTIINAHFVTVVGEVPARTVEKVGSAIVYLDETES
jgi:sigma-E factor negative regulatory protein RseB